MSEDSQQQCRVCGTQLAAGEKRCQKCGAVRGTVVPAFLKCRTCDTVFPSRRAKCPQCGNVASPTTCTATLLPEGVSATSLDKKPMKTWKIVLLTVVAIGVLVGEYFLVAMCYANVTYHESIRLWDSAGSIDANRRQPDPVYQEPVATEVSDSTFDALLSGEGAVDEAATGAEAASGEAVSASSSAASSASTSAASSASSSSARSSQTSKTQQNSAAESYFE